VFLRTTGFVKLPAAQKIIILNIIAWKPKILIVVQLIRNFHLLWNLRYIAVITKSTVNSVQNHLIFFYFFPHIRPDLPTGVFF